MGIAMHGVIADNVRTKQSDTNATENHITVRVAMHCDLTDLTGEDIRASGDVELSMYFGRYPVPTVVHWFSIDLMNALARLPSDQAKCYRDMIKQAAIAAAEGNGSYEAQLSPVTARELDLSE